MSKATEVRLKEVLDDPSLPDSLKALMRIFDIQIEALMEERKELKEFRDDVESNMEFLEECVAESCHDFEAFKEVFKREVYSSTNPMNSVESNRPYQELEGLSSRATDPASVVDDNRTFRYYDKKLNGTFHKCYEALKAYFPRLQNVEFAEFLNRHT